MTIRIRIREPAETRFKLTNRPAIKVRVNDRPAIAIQIFEPQ